MSLLQQKSLVQKIELHLSTTIKDARAQNFQRTGFFKTLTVGRK